MKLKKAHRVYFVQKDSPRRMDYRFGYERTPESALKYHVAQWWRGDNGRLKKYIFSKGYDTRKEAEVLVSKYNEELVKSCPWEHYEVAKQLKLTCHRFFDIIILSKTINFKRETQMKRFTLRKVKQYSYSRQGWIIKDLGYVFAIYDREWKKNLETEYGWTWTCDKDLIDLYKYIDSAHSKEVAQYWADWLNANCAKKFGHKIRIPACVFNEGLKLYKNPSQEVAKQLKLTCHRFLVYF